MIGRSGETEKGLRVTRLPAAALAAGRAAVSERLKTIMIWARYHSRPAFLVIGAQKAGTTALYYYLAEHPHIVPSREKELGFFVPELFADWPEHPNHRILCPQGRIAFDDRRAYRRAAAWYHRQFPWPHELGSGQLTFEATPDYLYFPQAAKRIFDYDPRMKLIVLLRDPVERAFSAWNMYRSYGGYRPFTYRPKKETREFEAAIRAELQWMEAGGGPLDPGYVRRGLYHEQLVRYLQWFSRDQVLVLLSDDLKHRTSATLAQIASFLGLPEHRRQGAWEQMLVGDYDPAMPEPSRRLLREFYKPHNERLYRLLDRGFGW
jgi:Sulfotransferase family